MKAARTKDRLYKTGQVCPRSAVYEFAGYVDDDTTKLPSEEEHRIPLSQGERFPPIRSCAKAAWWKFVMDA